MNVIILCPYPEGTAASQRFRYEQYLPMLREAGIHPETSSFTRISTWHKMYKPGSFLLGSLWLIEGFARRLRDLLNIKRFDFVFIHREATPAGPPIFEWVIAKVLKKKIIYDFDDAIWLTDKANESPLVRFTRCRWKVRYIIKWSFRVSCGNPYLADYARQYNPQVIVNPTTIDIHHEHKPGKADKSPGEKTIIGWTGTHSTLKYLKNIVPVLQVFEKKFPQSRFLIIADRDPNLPLNNVIFRPWSRESEISDLDAIDIGIMPLPDDAWTKGKCGFKALQYMAMGIPAVISPVGINREIVHDGAEGYWCTNYDEWFNRLAELTVNPGKRIQMGHLGREKVVANYSTASNASNFLSLFQ